MAFHLVVNNLLFAILLINQASTATETILPAEKWNYEAAGRRDPFIPLIGTELGGGHKALLSPENLKLIGVLWGNKGYYALVKDGMDNGYILKRGDKVGGGHVSDVTRQGIVFEIMHAGVVTSYELRLQEEKK